MSAQSRFIVPVRYAAWLAGDLGRRLEATLRTDLAPLRGLRVTRMPRGFLVECDEAQGVAVEGVARAVQAMEAHVADTYPVFHHEMGPVWTGVLQVLYAKVPA